MAEVKWIKLSTQMFEDEKIKLIEQMPEADTILIIWVKLLAQAGKTNASGYIFLSKNIPYTDEMLATIFNRPLPIVRMALQTFQRFGMIEIDEHNFINISNWEKHQNIEGMEKIREQNRIRKQRQRAKQKVLSAPSNESHVTSRDSHATEIDKELDKDIDKENNILSGKPDDVSSEKDEIPYKLIIDLLNKVAGTKYRHTTAKTRSLIKARWNEGNRFDDFKHVILVKWEEWRGSDMDKYLRPETLFGTKFENYRNQKPKGGSRIDPGTEDQYSGLF
ncbi:MULTISPECIES: phage replisome organizer N-terminal domain-containing protein [Bacillus]|uniref:phage replisome organizer N-terminal domain-containing protein n=1 Tax=Bacillus TaxID=1386 RepID=UPI0022439BE3|nr:MULTISPECIES: phage replisome organizer N-terminal domain-containing protein [Bacillus]MDN5389846.1 phage replisome organizer N-terminal domain-containing protein [Bacillus sp. LB7]MEC1023789.1 phage replisome organizer N-terminal domain-containing protein [Bacillus paralicheniformis]MEC1026635.1 phage replisome organizer N-terminal domain-containing protein [Bacillus paralicheniformis]MEC1037055.1 phage replisome organizer N-terminal domain-containing protein [Bacillus paralicheniformis]ME